MVVGNPAIDYLMVMVVMAISTRINVGLGLYRYRSIVVSSGTWWCG